MINKEILEIRKLLKKDENSAIRLCACYVNGEDKVKIPCFNSYLSNLPDSEQHKFIDIMKKTLSGTLGKNLHNLEFTENAKLSDGQQLSLLSLLNTELKSDEALDAFYDHIIANFDYSGNYVIFIMYDIYNVPVKTSDNIKLDDSVDVFKYVICNICPVNPSKAALSYYEKTHSIENRVRDLIIDLPCVGFMFPAFNDRCTDIHNLLYYVKTTKEMYDDFITEGLGCEKTMPSDKQKEIFHNIVEHIVINQPEYEVVDVVRNINENLTSMIENNTYDEPVKLNKDAVKDLFKRSGVKEEDLEKVDTKFKEELDEKMEFAAENVQEKKRFEVKTNDVVISVKPENSQIVKIKMIDGVKCLVIPMDNNVEINGIMSSVREHLENAGVKE